MSARLKSLGIGLFVQHSPGHQEQNSSTQTGPFGREPTGAVTSGVPSQRQGANNAENASILCRHMLPGVEKDTATLLDVV